MLVLSRNLGESIIIGDNIVVTLIDICGNKVRLGIEAPKYVAVHRREIYEAITENGRSLTSHLEKGEKSGGKEG